MRYLLTILLLIGLINSHSQKAGMRQLWWNIMPVTYVPGEPPPPPVLGIFGFGVNAQGASAGDPVITVTNTNTSGAGSLSNAIFGGSNNHKKIVFNIPGTGPHVIASDFTIDSDFSFVTIDGTGEIIIIDSPNSCGGEPCNDGLSFENASVNHIIVKNIHFRDCQDGANVVDGAHDIAFVNCAFWLNWDGNIDIASNSHNNTVQYCVIGNHTNACHCGSGGAGGMLITGFDNTAHHNLFNPGTTANPDEGERMPLVHGNYSNAFADFRYNIVYNYGRANATGSGFGSLVGYSGAGSGCGCFGRANFVNNYYYTPSTTAAPNGVVVSGFGVPTGDGYSAGNISGNGFNFNTGVTHTNSPQFAVASQFQLPFETTCEAVHNVLNNAGPDTKDAAVTAFIAGVTNLGTCYMMPPSLLFPLWKPDNISFNGIWIENRVNSFEVGEADIIRKRKINNGIYI